jgi:hypothetical protein
VAGFPFVSDAVILILDAALMGSLTIFKLMKRGFMHASEERSLRENILIAITIITMIYDIVDYFFFSVPIVLNVLMRPAFFLVYTY